jgi:uncharacterized protein
LLPEFIKFKTHQPLAPKILKAGLKEGKLLKASHFISFYKFNLYFSEAFCKDGYLIPSILITTPVMLDNQFDKLTELVRRKLSQLDPRLTYHNVAHTMDVLQQSVRIAKEEGVGDKDILLLKVAALYHDSGFLRTYKNHEEMSYVIFLEDAEEFEFSEAERQRIQGLIMATKVPQQPQNHLERIICDADLDYLGRDDFFTTGKELRKEFLSYGIIKNDEEWDQLQINFLSKHHYHTETSKQQREKEKQRHFQQLI